MTTPKKVSVGKITFANDLPFVLISGPCQIESREHTLGLAEKLVKMTDDLGIPLIFKASFDKANRTSIHGARGIGLEKGVAILAEVRETYGCPVITDIHTAEQCEQVAPYVDILQTPAYLCRQTDLMVAAAKTGKVIHVKKGQFLAPWDMKNVAQKLADSGNENILLCERGACFGYNTLVSDMRSLPIMAETGYPVVFDATHSVQQPGGLGGSTGGDRRMVPYLACAAVAVGVAGLFFETHEDPDKSPSDGPNMVPLHAMPQLLDRLKKIDTITKGNAS